MRQFSRNVVRNSAFGMGAQIAIKLLSFCFTVLIVRNLSVDMYGQYVAIMAFWSIFIFVADLGLNPYAVRQVAHWQDAADGLERTGALFGNMISLRLILALVAAVLVVTTAWLTDRPPAMVGAIALGTFIMLCYAVHGPADAILAGFERLDLSSRAKVINQTIFVICGGAALWLGLGYYGLIIASLIGVAAMTFACWRSVRMLGVHAQRAIARSWLPMLRASFPFGVISFTLGLSYKFDSVLLNIFRSDAETGYYNAAYNLVFSTVIISNVINTALYPSLARQAASAPESLPAIYERALRYLLMLALPIAVGCWALADQIVPFLFTAAYLPAILALQMVIWVVPLMFVSEFLGYVVLVAGAERFAARAVIFSTGFNVLLNLLIVPRFGFLGAAIMTVITEAILVSQYVWLLRVSLRQINWQVVLVRPLLAVIAMGGLALALRGLPLLLNVALSGIAYAGLLLAFGIIGRDELRFLRGIRRSAEGSATP